MKPYMRPPPHTFKPEADGSLLFMQTKTSATPVYQPDDGGAPYSEIRMWGVTESAHSIVVLVRNFKPYFLVKLMDHMSVDVIVRDLNAYLAEEYAGQVPDNEFVIATEWVDKKSIMGYKFEKDAVMKLLKVTLCAPFYLAKARDALEDAVITGGHMCKTYEANVLFTMRFMVDVGVSGCQWVRIPAGAYQLTKGEVNFRTSLVAICMDYTRIEPIPPGVKGELGPWRWLSYDIEACRYTPGFPKAEEDSVTQLCFVLEQEGKGVIWKQAFCLVPAGKSCSTLYGVDLRIYEDKHEAQMLKDVRQFIIDCDPDFLTGWNVDKFDNPYVFRDRPLGKGICPPGGAIRSAERNTHSHTHIHYSI